MTHLDDPMMTTELEAANNLLDHIMKQLGVEDPVDIPDAIEELKEALDHALGR